MNDIYGNHLALHFALQDQLDLLVRGLLLSGWRDAGERTSDLPGDSRIVYRTVTMRFERGL